ncbi:WPP domain-associated protein-like [Dorcoceras hygrometricum]|uniref:WPP domain-associated protein-like n=1 Tax=Dorcoceras hygrometricum TaxID=472368 RepID=A0A2Z7CY68_9LAMI|nr:WPP domain-associated protein-like [Dorcoceras hygrometricum]
MVNSDLGRSTVNSNLGRSPVNSDMGRSNSQLRSGMINSALTGQLRFEIVNSALSIPRHITRTDQISSFNSRNDPLCPPHRAVAALRMKQIALENQSRSIRRLRAKLATERRESVATKEGLETKVSSLERDLQIQRCDNRNLRTTVTLYHKDIDRRISQLVEAKKEHKTNQVSLEASHKTIAGLTEKGLCMSKKIERMKAKKQQTRESHLECHHKLQARIQEAEDTIQEQHLIIDALVEYKASLLQAIQGLQEDNGAPAPFDDEWEEEPEEDPEEEGLEDIPVGKGEIVDE